MKLHNHTEEQKIYTSETQPNTILYFFNDLRKDEDTIQRFLYRHAYETKECMKKSCDTTEV